MYHKSQKDTVLALYHTIIPACSRSEPLIAPRGTVILGQEGQRDGERGRRIILFFSPLYYMVKAVKLCVKSAEVSCHNTTQQLCFYLSLTSLLDCGWLQILDSGVYIADIFQCRSDHSWQKRVCVCVFSCANKEVPWLFGCGFWTLELW